ncbi:MAG: YCF48-related protein [Bacteroidota bacterium]
MKRAITISLLFFLSITTLSQNSGWIVLNSVPVASALNDIFAFNSQTAIAVGNNGIIIKTANGGDTWTALEVTSNVNLYSIYFVNSQIGWIAGNDRTILKTTNGGESWFQQFSTMSNRHAKDIFFINENTGWFVCRDDWFTSIAIVYSTNDGGNSWSSHLTGSSWNYNSICFVSAIQGLIVGGGGNIFKSNDGEAVGLKKQVILQTI